MIMERVNERTLPVEEQVPSSLKEKNLQAELKKEGVEVPYDVTEILSSLPEEKRHIIVGALCAIEKSSSFRGPLPPPEILAGYEKILPGASERILSMAEKQQDHRINMEATIVKEQTRQSANGQLWGAVLATLFGIGAVFLGYTGHDWLAGVMATTTIIGLATIFVLNKKFKESEKENIEEENEN